MWKYNKFNLGDIISHNESPSLEFQVGYVLRSEPDKKGDYLYSCILVDGHPDELGQEFKYHESDIFLKRGGTKKELEDLMDIAVKDEDYELAGFLKNQIEKL